MLPPRDIDSNTIITGDFTPPPLPTYINGQIIQIESQQGNSGLKLNIGSGGCDRFAQRVPSKCIRMHFLLKHTQNILNYRSYVWSQNNIEYI